MKLKHVIFGVVAVILLFFIWYTVSPLFIDEVVDEDVPVSESSEEVIVEETNETHISSEYLGSFTSADSFHKVSGIASVFSQNDVMYLRFEEFESTNGPDLYVYLSIDKDNNDYVSLGKLKGNIGNQNYVVSEDVDFEKYSNVLIWCQRFGVLFGSAEIEKV